MHPDRALTNAEARRNRAQGSFSSDQQLARPEFGSEGDRVSTDKPALRGVSSKDLMTSDPANYESRTPKPTQSQFVKQAAAPVSNEDGVTQQNSRATLGASRESD